MGTVVVPPAPLAVWVPDEPLTVRVPDEPFAERETPLVAPEHGAPLLESPWRTTPPQPSAHAAVSPAIEIHRRAASDNIASPTLTRAPHPSLPRAEAASNGPRPLSQATSPNRNDERGLTALDYDAGVF